MKSIFLWWWWWWGSKGCFTEMRSRKVYRNIPLPWFYNQLCCIFFFSTKEINLGIGLNLHFVFNSVLALSLDLCNCYWFPDLEFPRRWEFMYPCGDFYLVGKRCLPCSEKNIFMYIVGKIFLPLLERDFSFVGKQVYLVGKYFYLIGKRFPSLPERKDFCLYWKKDFYLCSKKISPLLKIEVSDNLVLKMTYQGLFELHEAPW